MMSRPMMILSLVAWLAVGTFWFFMTQDFHPMRALAVIVTTSLVVAYAAAAYINHLILVPRFWQSGRRGPYILWLAVTMLGLNTAALAVIRVSYLTLFGPDADPNGVYKHFAIDLFGMAVHLCAAAIVVAAAKRWLGRKGPAKRAGEAG